MLDSILVYEGDAYSRQYWELVAFQGEAEQALGYDEFVLWCEVYDQGWIMAISDNLRCILEETIYEIEGENGFYKFIEVGSYRKTIIVESDLDTFKCKYSKFVSENGIMPQQVRCPDWLHGDRS